MALVPKTKGIYLPSFSPGAQENPWVGELCLVLACASGWWNWSVCVSRCLFPVVECKWHVGDKQGLVKLRTCGKVNAVKGGGEQQNWAKTITSHCLLSIVLNQRNICNLNNCLICHLTEIPSNSSLILRFTASFSTQLSLQLLLDGVTALGLTEKFSVRSKVSLQRITALKSEVYECHN